MNANDVECKLKMIVNTTYPKLRSWSIFVDSYNAGTKLVVDFRIRDVVQWKVYLITNGKNKVYRVAKYLSVDLFTNMRHRNHHDLVFQNQWLGGGFCCAILYENTDDLYWDFSRLIAVTVADSTESVLQIDIANALSASTYSINVDTLLLTDPPSLF